MEYLHTNQYFTCSSGLAPAKMSSTQSVVKYDEGKYPLLTKQSTATSQMGDFCCRWAVVLAAAVVALVALTGGAALLALGIGLLASGLVCGALFAPGRQWVNEKGNFKIGQIEALTARAQMTCSMGGVITVAPGIDSPWKAMLYTARNTGWALMEGYFVGKTLAGGGSALMANGAAGAGKYFLGNMLFMQGLSRSIGAVDQVGFEGLLREGKNLGDAVKDHALEGFTMFEQPFINIYKKATGQVKDPQGNDVPLNWQDFYGAALSVMGTREMTKAAMKDVNMPKEAVQAIKYFTEKVGNGIKGKAYELMGALRPEDFGLRSIAKDPILKAAWEQTIAEFRNSRRDNAVKRYDRGGDGREAFNVVRDRFNTKIGNTGTNNQPIHHWNYPIERNSNVAINPENLSITNGNHADIHRATSSNPANIYAGPTKPFHRIPISTQPPNNPIPVVVVPVSPTMFDTSN